MLRSAGLVASKASLLPSLLTATLSQCPHVVTSLRIHVCPDLSLQGSQACWVGAGAQDYSFTFIPVTTASRLTLDDTQDQDTKQGMLFALGFSIHSGALISVASPGGGGPSTGGLLNLPNNLLV